jgi:hypothetical protein
MIQLILLALVLVIDSLGRSPMVTRSVRLNGFSPFLQG